MPNITKQFHIDITPEQFLNACDATELQELDLLLGKPKYQQKMAPLSRDQHIILEDTKKFLTPTAPCSRCGEGDDLPHYKCTRDNCPN